MATDATYSLPMFAPPAYVQPAVAEGTVWPIYGQVSSGCLLLIECFDEGAIRPGYAVVRIEKRAKIPVDAVNNFSGPMEEIRRAFGRTFSRLPAVFGVSRQTLYNWLGGEMPKERHQARILQLADAARTFTEMSFTPTAASLTRTLSRGKPFLELLSDGADGGEAAQKLITLTQRSLASRARLDSALAGIAAAPSANFGFAAPALDEDVS
jgi:hypothetical protein